MPEHIRLLIADLLGYAVTVLCLLSPQMKRKWQILMIAVFANTLSGVNFLLLGQVSAVGVSVAAVAQALLGMRRSKDTNGATPLPEVLGFGALYVLGGLLPFIIGRTMSQFGALDAMPIFGALLLCASMAQTKEQHMRLFALANSVVFVIYDIIIHSTQVYAQIITIVSIVVALIRFEMQRRTAAKPQDAADDPSRSPK